jgi:hypothetical protein
VSCDSIDGTIIVKGTLVQGDMRVVFIEHAGRAAFADEIKRADDRVAATLASTATTGSRLLQTPLR